jgi:hypothetical protein
LNARSAWLICCRFANRQRLPDVRTRPPPDPQPEESAEAEGPAASPSRWKCKPCGALVEIAASMADEEAVRCPSCNARLGRVGQFRAEGPEQQKVRARPAPLAAIPAAHARRERRRGLTSGFTHVVSTELHS